MKTRIRSEAESWLRFAREDPQQASRILAQPDFVPRHAAWLAQQAAEKAITAVLILHEIPFPRTHDLELLFTLLPRSCCLAATSVDLSRLSEYSVEVRYPGDWPEISFGEVTGAFSDAGALVDAAAEEIENRAK